MSEASEEIVIDLSETQRAAEHVRATLRKLRADFNLARYEYTRRVRIAPGEIPHSHPILTLNTRVQEEAALLSTYLHEQMHWYVTWYSWTQSERWRELFAALLARYPRIPVGFPEGAHTVHSSYLHLLVNWLEIETTSQMVGREKTIEVAANNFVYSGLYKIVLADLDALAELYHQYLLLPLRPAPLMTAEDLAIAARMDESPVVS
jgi:hypothetical protein